jgi:ATP-binding cassette subfamily B (MDR/TAP) protein 10
MVCYLSLSYAGGGVVRVNIPSSSFIFKDCFSMERLFTQCLHALCDESSFFLQSHCSISLQVRSFGGERRQTSRFDEEVLAYQKSGNKLGWLKSTNESWTRIAIYVSLMALYVLGGSKVKAGQLSVGTMVSFIGYTFTLTFAVQGMVNTLADLRGMLAAVERVNNVVASAQVDEWLAHGLEREARGELQGNGDCVNPTTNEIVASEEDAINGSTIPLKVATTNLPAVESRRTVCDLAWSGDVVLEGMPPEL